MRPTWYACSIVITILALPGDLRSQNISTKPASSAVFKFEGRAVSIGRRKVSGIYISRVLHAVEHAESSQATQREGVYRFIRTGGSSVGIDAEVTLSRIQSGKDQRRSWDTCRGGEKWSERARNEKGRSGFGCISSRESIFRSGIRSTIVSDGNGSDSRPGLSLLLPQLRSSLSLVLTDPLRFPSLMSSCAKSSLILSQHDGSYRPVVSFRQSACNNFDGYDT